jgi:hypothetical protein
MTLCSALEMLGSFWLHSSTTEMEPNKGNQHLTLIEKFQAASNRRLQTISVLQEICHNNAC